MVVEEGWWMGSLFEELEAREAAARVRVEELEAAIAELSGKLVLAQDGLERLRMTLRLWPLSRMRLWSGICCQGRDLSSLRSFF
ncbi:hypothetical protein [Streptomyces sp. NPDC047009]|uniref:hypothetical protein n=1 Tax=unclassified Streptomyces TaxID=2593676 RepID=UPI0033EB0C68